MQPRLDSRGFTDLLHRLGDAWAGNDPLAAAECFTTDAAYMEPPAEQLFRGRRELIAYFTPLQPGTYLSVHGSWFDEAAQTGAAEFTFGVAGSAEADHGVVIIELSNGLIASWREYVRRGPSDFARFTAIDDKEWRWHAGNYP